MHIASANLVLTMVLSMNAADLEPGRQLRKDGKLDEAIAFFQQALEAEPASPEILLELGHAFVLAGRYDEAIETYQPLASQNLRWQLDAAKWTALAHLYHGNIAASLEQRGVEERLAAQLGENAAASSAARQVGYLYSEIEQFASANDAFVSALNRDPNDIQTLYLMALLAVRQGDWGSLRYQILDLEPVAARSHDPALAGLVDHLNAELAISRGDEGEALELLGRSATQNAMVLEARARAYAQHGDLARAEAAYQSIVDATDERLEFPLVYVKALLGEAKVLDAQGRREEAASFYRRFLEHWGNTEGPLPGVAEARSGLQRDASQP